MRKNPVDSKGRTLRANEYERDGYYIYTYKDASGTWRQKSCKYLMKGDIPSGMRGKAMCLRDIEKDVQKKVDAGINVSDAGKITLNQQFENYMATKKNLSVNSVIQYRKMWDNYVRDGIGKRRLDSIKYSDVLNLYTELLFQKNLSFSTLKTLNKVLNPTFNMAVRDDLIHKNPAKGVLSELKDREEYTQPKKIALTVQQEERFLQFVENSVRYSRYYNLFYTMLVTGMRIGEVCALRWEDIYFSEREIHVNLGLTYNKAPGEENMSYKVGKTKTPKAVRVIPMFPGDELDKVLSAEYAYQSVYGFNENVIDGYSGFVFRSPSGGMVNASTVNTCLDTIVKQYNKKEQAAAERDGREPELLPHISCHTMRHTFITRLCERSNDIPAIMDIVGHANFNLTSAVYNEVQNEHRRNNANEVFSVLGKAATG